MQKKLYSTDFHIIGWKGGTRATEETIIFWRYSRSRYTIGIG